MGYVTDVQIGNNIYPVGSSLYGTCATEAGTAAKVVTMSNFDTLKTGVTIHVKFTYSNSVADPTLNVNNTGAKSIYRFATISPGSTIYEAWNAGAVVSFTYDGNAWIMNESMNYDATKLPLTGGTLTGNLAVQNSVGNHSVISAISSDTSCAVRLGSNTNGHHGIYSPGYWNGTQYVEDSGWMIYRDTTGAILVNGHSSRDVPLTGNVDLTGWLRYKRTDFDLSKADNDVSDTKYPALYSVTDGNSRTLARVEGQVYANGDTGSFWYIQNYNTSGESVGLKGIRMTMDKSGQITYSVSDPIWFVNAIGALPLTGGTLTGDLVVSATNTVGISTISTTSTARITMRSDVDGIHGIYSNGYWNGTTFTSANKWMIYRDTSGAVIVNGDITGSAIALSGINSGGTAQIGTTSRPTTGDANYHDNKLRYYLATSSMTIGKPANDAHILHMAWDNAGWDGQIALFTGSTQTHLQIRSEDGSGTWNAWTYVLDANNYSSYALPLTGGTLTGNLIVQRTGENAYIIAKSNDTSVSTYLHSDTGGTHGVYSNGYWNGTTFTSSGKRLVYRDTAGKVYCDGHANLDLALSGGTMTGDINMSGSNLNMKTTSSSSDDCGDIVFYYGNGQEKSRIWVANTYSAKSGPNYRVYNSSGTSLYSGTLPLADGTGASGTWGISVTGYAASVKDSANTNTITFSYSSAGLAYADYTYIAVWNGYQLRAANKNQFAQASHSHSYLPLSGGTLTGSLTIKPTATTSNAGIELWGTAPYIDFHYNYSSTYTDYCPRLIAVSEQQLRVTTQHTSGPQFGVVASTNNYVLLTSTAIDMRRTAGESVIRAASHPTSDTSCQLYMTSNVNGVRGIYGTRLDATGHWMMRFANNTSFGDFYGRAYRENVNTSWINALLGTAGVYLYNNGTTGFNAIATAKCPNGAWTIGALNSDSNFYIAYGNNTRLTNQTNGTDGSFKFDTSMRLTCGKAVLTSTQDAQGTTDNSPALVIGTQTGAHLEFDPDEIMAKASGTTTAGLYLNWNGGVVNIGGGGISTSGQIVSTYHSGTNKQFFAGNTGSADEAGYYARNSLRLGQFVVTGGSNLGIYDSTNGNWMIVSNSSQVVNVPHPLTTTSAAGSTGRRVIITNATANTMIDEIYGTSGNAIGVKSQWGGSSWVSKSVSTSSSDVRLKTNISDTKINGLELVNKIRVRQFDWIDKEYSDGEGFQKIGFVADELEELDDKLAIGGGYLEDGTMNVKSVDTFYLIGYLTKAIQELSDENKELKSRINRLENK